VTVNNTAKHISVLLFEKNGTDAERIRQLLPSDGEKQGACSVLLVSTLDDALRALNDRIPIDVVLCAFTFGDRDDAHSFEKIKSSGNRAPLILIAENYNQQDASVLIGKGAQDILIKNQIDTHLLMQSIHYAIQRSSMYRQLESQVKEFQIGEARLLNVVLHNADGIVVVDNSGIVRFVNPAAEVLFDCSAQSMIGKPFAYSRDAISENEFVLERGPGKKAVIEIRAVRTDWEGLEAVLYSLRDITLRKKAEKILRESEERYALAIRGSEEGVWDWDLNNNIIYYGQQWKEMLGFGDEEITESPDEWLGRIHTDDSGRVNELLELHLSGESDIFECEYRIQHKNGGWLWVLSRGKALRTSQGKAYRLAGSQYDITNRKNAEVELKKALNDLQFALASEKVLMEELDRKNRELIELSITDGLTRLYNHRFLQERFDFELKRVKRYGGYLSCMMIDIDHFKKLNDTYGHQFGDEVLHGVSQIIKNNSREVDICGRYGGEEFMLITNQRIENSLKHASKIHEAIEKAEFPFQDSIVHVTVSIGLAEYKSDIKTKQELIDQADEAMYEAKEGGRNLVRIWKEKDDDDVVRLDKLGIASLKNKFISLSQDMRAVYMESTNALVKAVEAKDPFTQHHASNVAKYAVELAHVMKLPEVEIEVIRYAALLHDIGKIGVDQEILTKTDPLTDEEFTLLKKHPVIGVNILKDVKFLEKEIPIILHHHERIDGKGYPHGLKEREIPQGASILAVCDAFDAMTAGRTYRDKISVDAALVELEKGKGTQFAPTIVDTFISLHRNRNRNRNR